MYTGQSPSSHLIVLHRLEELAVDDRRPLPTNARRTRSIGAAAWQGYPPPRSLAPLEVSPLRLRHRAAPRQTGLRHFSCKSWPMWLGFQLEILVRNNTSRWRRGLRPKRAICCSAGASQTDRSRAPTASTVGRRRELRGSVGPSEKRTCTAMQRRVGVHLGGERTQEAPNSTDRACSRTAEVTLFWCCAPSHCFRDIINLRHPPPPSRHPYW